VAGLPTDRFAELDPKSSLWLELNFIVTW
jgi:hypothetical protein